MAFAPEPTYHMDLDLVMTTDDMMKEEMVAHMLASTPKNVGQIQYGKSQELQDEDSTHLSEELLEMTDESDEESVPKEGDDESDEEPLKKRRRRSNRMLIRVKLPAPPPRRRKDESDEQSMKIVITPPNDATMN